MEYRVKGNKITAALLCVFIAAVCFWTSRSFLEMRKPDMLIPAPGFNLHMLSEWEPGLKGTNADTPVYIQEGEKPGGTVYIQGGIHANEPAGLSVCRLEHTTRPKTRHRKHLKLTSQAASSVCLNLDRARQIR